MREERDEMWGAGEKTSDSELIWLQRTNSFLSMTYTCALIDSLHGTLSANQRRWTFTLTYLNLFTAKCCCTPRHMPALDMWISSFTNMTQIQAFPLLLSIRGWNDMTSILSKLRNIILGLIWAFNLPHSVIIFTNLNPHIRMVCWMFLQGEYRLLLIIFNLSKTK